MDLLLTAPIIPELPSFTPGAQLGLAGFQSCSCSSPPEILPFWKYLLCSVTRETQAKV